MVESYFVNSAIMSEVRYHEDEKILELVSQKGNAHKFSDVPQHLFYELVDAPSKTAFYLERIIDFYARTV